MYGIMSIIIQYLKVKGRLRSVPQGKSPLQELEMAETHVKKYMKWCHRAGPTHFIKFILFDL